LPLLRQANEDMKTKCIPQQLISGLILK